MFLSSSQATEAKDLERPQPSRGVSGTPFYQILIITLGKLEGQLTGEAASIPLALLLSWPMPGGLKDGNASARSISAAAQAEGRQNGALWP